MTGKLRVKVFEGEDKWLGSHIEKDKEGKEIMIADKKIKTAAEDLEEQMNRFFNEKDIIIDKFAGSHLNTIIYRVNPVNSTYSALVIYDE